MSDLPLLLLLPILLFVIPQGSAVAIVFAVVFALPLPFCLSSRRGPAFYLPPKNRHFDRNASQPHREAHSGENPRIPAVACS
ncbi:MAG: hypothetical protein ACRD3K_08460 [Edaphobacter sp.]